MHEILPPLTENGFAEPEPESPNMVLVVTPEGAVRLMFSSPVTFVDMDYDQATELQKGIHRALRQIRRARNHPPPTPPIDLHKARELRIARAARARGKDTRDTGDNGRIS